MEQQRVEPATFFWLLAGLCALHGKPYSAAAVQRQFVAPHTPESLGQAAGEHGFSFQSKDCRVDSLHSQSFPLLAWLHVAADEEPVGRVIDAALVLQADNERVLLIAGGEAAPVTMTLAEFAPRYTGRISLAAPRPDAVNDPDQSDAAQARTFGFRWFIPELLKHRKLWRDILLASLAIQLIALATPLFTQTVIDKVVVHRTESTLIVIAGGMLAFMLFSAVLTWLRQYLVLHTGNRVDAVLGATVFTHLFRLPPIYFQHRPTGVIAARLHGVETIREFIAGTAVTLVLDLPFLLIFVGIMFYYSVTLTLIVLAVLALTVALSLWCAPLFQTHLQEQFQLDARNQAFLTEYLSGMETVKSLQLEPQLNSRYRGYLSRYLQAAFAARQLGNTYNTVAGLLEQCMSLLVLGIGAYAVMRSTDFTIGMLVAFQMFAGKLSQPMLRMVGLWQQFQQASLSVTRLGDLMNAPAEPYAAVPAAAREPGRQGAIRIEQLAFRYAAQPLLYENLSLTIAPGQTVAIMGPSGCGKSTLTKLLQGFYRPNGGRILVDDVDISHLSCDALRSHFGVVPQETTLFSGTIYDNLAMANPHATFGQIVSACKMAEIHHAVEALPQGYQTEIGERGAGLSGGQKQRIAIARALLKRPGILVFDEATSALDSATAEQFARTINKLRGKVTMLFITHGLPKGLHVDAIFRLTPQGAERVQQAAATEAATMSTGAC